jgi:hypothetical protein
MFDVCQFEQEMIIKLDLLVTGGHGDEQYQEMFYDVYGLLCLHSFSRNVIYLLNFQSFNFVSLPFTLLY